MARAIAGPLPLPLHTLRGGPTGLYCPPEDHGRKEELEEELATFPPFQSLLQNSSDKPRFRVQECSHNLNYTLKST